MDIEPYSRVTNVCIDDKEVNMCLRSLCLWKYFDQLKNEWWCACRLLGSHFTCYAAMRIMNDKFVFSVYYVYILSLRPAATHHPLLLRECIRNQLFSHIMQDAGFILHIFISIYLDFFLLSVDGWTCWCAQPFYEVAGKYSVNDLTEQNQRKKKHINSCWYTRQQHT